VIWGRSSNPFLVNYIKKPSNDLMAFLITKLGIHIYLKYSSFNSC
jgi:hypothetical protein